MNFDLFYDFRMKLGFKINLLCFYIILHRFDVMFICLKALEFKSKLFKTIFSLQDKELKPPFKVAFIRLS